MAAGWRREASRSAFLAYCAAGAALVLTASDVPQWYVVVFYFLAFKTAFGYEKCTVSYLECKLRGVRKEEGWIYAPLHDVVTLRESDPALAAVLLLGALLGAHYFAVLGRGIAF